MPFVLFCFVAAILVQDSGSPLSHLELSGIKWWRRLSLSGRGFSTTEPRPGEVNPFPTSRPLWPWITELGKSQLLLEVGVQETQANCYQEWTQKSMYKLLKSLELQSIQQARLFHVRLAEGVTSRKARTVPRTGGQVVRCAAPSGVVRPTAIRCIQTYVHIKSCLPNSR